jgi:D-glycero-D-manno-heptose 1,7-bisphosphate phosphatase
MRAIFLDRDGVLNELLFNQQSMEYEPPRTIDDINIKPKIFICLENLQKAGFELFIVSNQPDYAKGKVSFETIFSIRNEFQNIMELNGIFFRDYYYCYHHPRGIIADYSFECQCRKPKPFFLIKAQQNYGIDLNTSWMIGDRDDDILCGQAAGTKTILINEPCSRTYQGHSKPDFIVNTFEQATFIILKLNRS